MNFMAIMLEKISRERHIAAIRRGLLFNIPFIIVGCFALMINNITLSPPEGIGPFYIGSPWRTVWQVITDASLNIMSVLLVLSTSYFLAETHDQVKKGILHPLSAALVSLTCLMAIIQPFAQGQTTGTPFAWIGLGGILLAIMIALIATEIFLRLCSVFRTNTELNINTPDPVIYQVLTAILPAAATIVIFVLLKIGAAEIAIADIHQHVNIQIAQLIAWIPGNFGKVVVFNLLVHLLWFLGLHGNNIMEPALMFINFNGTGEVATIISQATGDNGRVLTKTFQDVFILMGGSGSSVCLLLALLCAPRRSSLTRLIKFAMIPAFFNVNEILIFGLPIVLNPVYLIPFILVPVVLAIVSYTSISLGFVPVIIHGIHWTTPVLLSGYLATESWRGVLLQLAGILIGTGIYLPFVIISEKHRAAEVQQAFNDFLAEHRRAKHYAPTSLLLRHDHIGALARILTHDLKEAICKQTLFLEYQPQINAGHRVIGVEALLRWSHQSYGLVPTPLIIAIAEEAGLIQELGKWVISTAGRQLGHWKDMGIKDVRMAVNISVTQLRQGSLVDDVASVVAANGLKPCEIELEITEDIALENDAKIDCTMEKLLDLGVRIAIDDFGAGHTSLRYIKHFPVHTLKIDHVLSCDVAQDRNCQEIITSMVSLCSSLNIDTIVEYVETREQFDILKQLSCALFQGYYFSPPLSSDNIMEYIRHNNSAAEPEAACTGTADNKVLPANNQ
jgi:lactose/cellobiose-specific phosphotransferase system IIC component